MTYLKERAVLLTEPFGVQFLFFLSPLQKESGRSVGVWAQAVRGLGGPRLVRGLSSIDDALRPATINAEQHDSVVLQGALLQAVAFGALACVRRGRL